jgi:hypothetical protein
MRHRCSLETFALDLRTKKQAMLQTSFPQNRQSGGWNASPKPPQRYAFAELIN